MCGTLKRFILSGIDIQRGVLDYVEQFVEKEPEGEKSFETLKTRVGDDIQHLRETLRDVVKNTLQAGLHQIDDKLNVLNERISTLEGIRPAPKPAPRKPSKSTAARKPAAKRTKTTRKKSPPIVGDEPIIGG